jgi:hypothetical protein
MRAQVGEAQCPLAARKRRDHLRLAERASRHGTPDQPGKADLDRKSKKTMRVHCRYLPFAHPCALPGELGESVVRG